MNIFPSQKKSYKEKMKVEQGEVVPQFIAQVADYFLTSIDGIDDDRAEMSILRNAAEGRILNSAYEHVLNPYDVQDPKHLNRPAELRNLDFISTVVASMVGERADLPLPYTVVSTNADIQNELKDQINIRLDAILQRGVINNLNDMGMQTGMPTQKIDTIANEAKKLRSTVDDIRSRNGQKILNYIEYKENLKDKYQDAWYDYVTVADTCTYKEVYRDDVKINYVPAEEIFTFHEGRNERMVEDCGAAVRWTRVPLHTIIDRWRSKINEEQIEALENYATTQGFNGLGIYQQSSDGYYHLSGIGPDKITNFELNGGLIDLYHIVWKSFRKVGILTYSNEFGTFEKEVSEDYVARPEFGDISIKWEWINQVWEIYVANKDDASRTFLEWGPLPVQRGDLNNSSICKLPYNGRRGYTSSKRRYSIVKKMLPYQLLYNIYHYRFEMLMAKNKDKLLMMPFGLIPKKWKMEKWMYFVEATGIGWFDESNKNVLQALQALKGIDLGLGNYVKETRDLMLAIREEAYDTVGFNRQRMGDVMASDRKTNTEYALMRSGIITAEINRRFDKLIESDLQGVLDYSKVAYINGKKGQYVNPRGEVEMLDIDGGFHASSNYGVFVKSTVKELQNVRKMEEFAFSLAQNDRNPAMVASILESDNISSIIKIMEDYNAIEKKYEQAAADADGARQAKIEELKLQAVQIQAEATKYSADMRYRATMDKASLDTEIALLEASMNANSGEGDDSDLDERKFALEARKLSMQSRLAEKEFKLSQWEKQKMVELKKEELGIKRKQANRPISSS